MTNLYLVHEHNGESYEDAHDWVLAAFSSEEDAEAFRKRLEEDYLANFERRVLLGKQQQAELDAIPDEVSNEDYQKLEIAILDKYPEAIDEWSTKHYFTLGHHPIPLNPTINEEAYS